jgi:hypothetical protein
LALGVGPVNASKVDCWDVITFDTDALKKEGSYGAVLGIEIVFRDVLQSLLDMSWFTFVIINFKAFGYCLGKNLWLTDNAL